MEEIERQSGAADTPLPCQYFDLIGGTSTGGLIAIMLGRLRMVSSLAYFVLLIDAVVRRRMYYELYRLEREGLRYRPSHGWQHSHRR